MFALKRATIGSAGYDFISDRDIEFKAGKWTEIDTGVCLLNEPMNEIPSWEKWVMFVAPRSSLGMKYGMRFANTLGIIDKDYNGTIRAKITCDVDFTIHKGEKLMQGIFLPFYTMMKEEKPTTVRDGGIGSTGA